MLSYGVTGQGERTLVFLHGFGGASGFWRWQVEAFALLARCVTVDLPGHGKSSWSGSGLAEMAAGVVQVLWQAGVRQAHFVASSFGGLVALEVWRRSPEVFSALTLTGSVPRFTPCDDFPAGLDVPKIRKLAGQFEGDVRPVLDMFFRSLFTMTERQSGQYARIKELRRAVGLPDRAALLSMLDILEQADLRDVFLKFDRPLQIVSGDQDYICPLAALAALRAMKPSARIDIFKGCGHFPFLSRPGEFNRVVREFAGW